MKKLLPIVIGVALLVGAGSFYGGMKYASAKSPTRNFQHPTGAAGGNAGFGGGQGPDARGNTMGSFITGEILSNDGKTLTVKGRDGSSKIVLLGDTTEVSLFVAGKPADLEVGKSVMVQGKANTDGSVTAQSVQLRPAMTPPSGSPGDAQLKK